MKRKKLKTGPKIVDNEYHLSAGDLLKLDLIEHKVMLTRMGVALAKADLEKFLLTLSQDQQAQFVQIQAELSKSKLAERMQAKTASEARAALGESYGIDFNDPDFSFDDETGRLMMSGGAVYKE